MGSNDLSESPRALPLGRWMAAHAAILTLVYVAGVAIFIVVAARLDVDFARAARERHLGLVAQTHLSVLPAYLLIWMAHGLVTYPIARRLAERRIRKGKNAPGAARTLLWAVSAEFAAFLFGLGPMTLAFPGSLDVLARVLSRSRFLAENVDVYGFATWRIREAFAAVVAVSILLLLKDAYRFLGRATNSWSRAPRTALFLVLGSVVGAPLGFALLGTPAVDPKSVDRPNVLIVAADSLRYDHLGCHGYGRDTSPNIDRLARESVDFQSMHVSTASTLESWATMLTGKYPVNHGLRYMFIGKQEAEAIAAEKGTLPRLLASEGYRTAVYGDWAANCFALVDFGFEKADVSDVQNLDVFLSEVAFRTHFLVSYYFAHAFGEALIPRLRQVTGYLGSERLTESFLAEFDRSATAAKPFFGVLFLSSTHLPYQPPHPWNEKFVDPAYRWPNRYQLEFKIDDFIKHGFEKMPPERERRHVVDLYDGGVAHFDSVVGRIADHLRATGLDRNTILIVTSDHGEDLYDPDTTLGHGTNFYGGDQSTRIPFIARLPGAQFGGRSVDRITRTVDILPTILEWTGSKSSPPAADGKSVAAYVAPEAEDLDLAAFAETCYLFYPKRVEGEDAYVLEPADSTLEIDESFRNLFVLKEKWRAPVIDTKDRMMRTKRWKLVYVKGRDKPIYRLYDMSADPTQRKDLSVERQDVVRRMAPVLEEWIRSGKESAWPAESDR